MTNLGTFELWSLDLHLIEQMLLAPFSKWLHRKTRKCKKNWRNEKKALCLLGAATTGQTTLSQSGN
jgi:hypothetical protein